MALGLVTPAARAARTVLRGASRGSAAVGYAASPIETLSNYRGGANRENHDLSFFRENRRQSSLRATFLRTRFEGQRCARRTRLVH